MGDREAWESAVEDETKRWTSSTWSLEDMQSELAREKSEWEGMGASPSPAAVAALRAAGGHRVSQDGAGAGDDAADAGDDVVADAPAAAAASAENASGEMLDVAMEAEGYIREQSTNTADGSLGNAEYEITEAENDVPHYQEHFAGKPHRNYVGESARGPVVLSVEAVDKEKQVIRSVFRSKRGEQRVVIPNGSFKTPFKDDSKALAALRTELADECGEVKLYEVRNPEDHTSIEQNLSAYEKKVTMVSHYKFGVLYTRGGQTNEDEWFNNNEPPQRFYDFLSCLGEKTALVGHKGYSGGLNTREEVTGTHSYYTQFKSFEIMFHVSPMLPYFPMDTQQVERKRHLGNDVVLIVYRDVENPAQENADGNVDMFAPFNPLTVNSHFNHIFMIVEPVIGDPTKFRVAVGTKAGVREYGPDVETSVFSIGERFRDFVLTKCINGERCAMHAGEFVRLWSKTREITLQNLVDTFQATGKKSKSGGSTIGKGSVKNFLKVVGDAKETAEKASAADHEMRRVAKMMTGNEAKNVIKDGRNFVFDGPVMKVCRKKNAPRHLFLFNDALAHCSSAAGRDKFVIHKLYDTNTTQIKDMPDAGSLKNAFQIITTEEKSFVVFTQTHQQKSDWLQKFETEVEMAKEGQEDAVAVWIPDSAAKACMICRTKFTFTNRRHHCRSCGDVVCGSCSKQKMAVGGSASKKELRVCKNCFRTKSGVGPVIKLESISSDDSQTQIALKSSQAEAVAASRDGQGAPVPGNSTVSSDYRPPGGVPTGPPMGGGQPIPGGPQPGPVPKRAGPGAPKRGFGPGPKRAADPGRGRPKLAPKPGFAVVGPKGGGPKPGGPKIGGPKRGSPPKPSQRQGPPPKGGPGPKRGLSPMRRGPLPQRPTRPPAAVTAPAATAPVAPAVMAPTPPSTDAPVAAPDSFAPAPPGSVRGAAQDFAVSLKPRGLRELLEEAEGLGIATESAENKDDVVVLLLENHLSPVGMKDALILCDELGLEQEAEEANDKTELCALAARKLSELAS
jgi:Rap/ran-GAP/FYVE zinc finger/SOS1/NGEF-like PH domain